MNLSAWAILISLMIFASSAGLAGPGASHPKARDCGMYEALGELLCPGGLGDCRLVTGKRTPEEWAWRVTLPSADWAFYRGALIRTKIRITARDAKAPVELLERLPVRALPVPTELPLRLVEKESCR